MTISAAMIIVLPLTFVLDPNVSIGLFLGTLRGRHAGRQFLRHPAEHTGHAVRRGDRTGRLPAGGAGPGRTRARHVGFGEFLRRAVQRALPVPHCTQARRPGASVPLGGPLQPGVPRPHHHLFVRIPVLDQGIAVGGHRAGHRHRRPGPGHGYRTVYLRRHEPVVRRAFSHRADRAFRHTAAHRKPARQRRQAVPHR